MALAWIAQAGRKARARQTCTYGEVVRVRGEEQTAEVQARFTIPLGRWVMIAILAIALVVLVGLPVVFVGRTSFSKWVQAQRPLAPVVSARVAVRVRLDRHSVIGRA